MQPRWNDMIVAMNFLDYISYILFFLLLAMLGVMLLCYTVAATMAQVSKEQDDAEQLALKFSHKK